LTANKITGAAAELADQVKEKVSESCR